jgi:hypothetical protein
MTEQLPSIPGAEIAAKDAVQNCRLERMSTLRKRILLDERAAYYATSMNASGG